MHTIYVYIYIFTYIFIHTPVEECILQIEYIVKSEFN
jgi:hypothetical protein